MIGDRKKLCNMSEYKRGKVIITIDNSKLPITNIGSTMIVPSFSPNQVLLKKVLHVPGMKKNLLSVPQLTSFGNYVVFEPDDVKVFRNLSLCGKPIVEV